jgi:hypothetical protein
MRVLWSAAADAGSERRHVAVLRSPLLRDVFVTVADFTFSVWQRGARVPLFTSPACPAPQTAAAWSPTRAGVLFVGRADGVVDAWDMLDSTVRPAVSAPLMSLPVTAMEFRTRAAAAAAGPGKQLLAVGDGRGSLHVLDVPGPLRRGAANEPALVAAYLEREAARTVYAGE